MANESPHPPSPAPNFPAEKTKTNQESRNGARKDAVYKTKEITFRGLKKRIILQNKNGPCPLIAICNVLLLRNKKNQYLKEEVSQERLLSLVDRALFYSDGEEYTNAIKLLPRFAEGINVNIRFRRIDDFELTPELDIFRLLEIALYHGWIVDPQDVETATAIGCKSYNDLMTELVTLKIPSSQSSGECSVDPSQSCSKTRSFAYSTPTSAEHSRLGRGDVEEERALMRALRLSERENLGLDTRRDSSSGGDSASGFSYEYQMPGFSSSGGESVSGFSYGYQMSEDGTLSEAVTVVSPDLAGRSQDVDVPLYEADEKCESLGSPVYEGESLVGQSSPEGKDANGLTPGEGEVIKSFLENNANQLTFTGLFFLGEGLKEGELCVFFRNNHFYTMLKHDNALYNLVTDEGYQEKGDLVWETLNQVNGDSVFMTGDFKVFNYSGKWDEQGAISNTADYIFNINRFSKEGMEIDPDLKIAMELQQQELSGGGDFDVL
ncbi:unnamed protein product [Thlaspi arvense]|uniref:MINDY deubiquitinase domain-containing protein n=1 Tax=Thlaspi arvense TaxID=13288 RepID=A0AAU9T2J6_THLAR|nr:unnamed protein product [Thlaspi arvense]